MEKTLKYLIGLAIAFILFFGLSSLFEGCGEENDARTQEIAEMTQQESDFEEDFFEEDPNSEFDENPIVVEEDPITLPQESEIIVDTPEFQPVSKPQPTKPKSKTVKKATGGKYMVLAGSYLLEKNAKNMANKLKRQGYNAEVVRFDYSKYYTVVAQRTNSRNTAVKTSSTLKNKGIDNYIHTKG